MKKQKTKDGKFTYTRKLRDNTGHQGTKDVAR